MKKQVSTVELLAIINGKKQAGESLEEIQKDMEAQGLHRENTKELYEMLI